LAKSALHFAVKMAAWLSVDKQAKSIQEELHVWHATKGKEILKLHHISVDKDEDEEDHCVGMPGPDCIPRQRFRRFSFPNHPKPFRTIFTNEMRS